MRSVFGFPTAVFFIALAYILGMLPFAVIYRFADFTAFVLRRISAYRKQVILENLDRIYPSMGIRERKKLVRGIYANLSDILVEGVKAFTMTRSQINRRHWIVNPEILDTYWESGRSIIVVTGHYNNWEWGAFSPSLQTKYKIVGFYKPLENRWIDNFARKSRSKFGTHLASIYETYKTFEENQGQAVIYLMAADQSPSDPDKSIWVNFLGQDTAFLHGPERYARMYNHAVMYVDVRRVKRGFYRVYLSWIADEPDQLPEGEITQRFAEKLESVIREDPANWLWSHRRWKLTR